MGDVTAFLNRWVEGDASARDEMMPLVYDELKLMARNFLSRERDSHSLPSAALVNEVYLRLVDQRRVRFNGRTHFYGAAANLMRRILVDHARQRLAAKRGSGLAHEPIEEGFTLAVEPDLDVVGVDDALTEFEAFDPERARVVELRYFGGLTIEEAAELLGVSPSKVSRDWTVARAWLYRRLNP
ncbi:MAG: sigma-70 family RNA polymerase sigma factor [Acidobacteriota bacterium]